PRLVAAPLAALDEIGDLGGGDQVGPGVARLADQAGNDFQIGLGIGAGGELDAGGGEGLAHAPRPSFGSSLPARSSATMSSQPPICSPSIKICGTVRPPPARLIISSRLPVS